MSLYRRCGLRLGGSLTDDHSSPSSTRNPHPIRHQPGRGKTGQASPRCDSRLRLFGVNFSMHPKWRMIDHRIARAGRSGSQSSVQSKGANVRPELHDLSECVATRCTTLASNISTEMSPASWEHSCYGVTTLNMCFITRLRTSGRIVAQHTIL